MPVKTPRVPSYCIHSARGLAYVRLNGEMIYLGKAESTESREKYDRLIAEWMNAGRIYVRPADKHAISVNEVLLAYRQYAGTIYVDDAGQPTPELERVNRSMKPVIDLYGTLPAVQFGPKSLVAIQMVMAERKLKRSTVNDRVKVIRRIFKWAAKEELVPANVFHGLQTVDGLRRGRSKAIESVPVKPVADHVVTAVLKHLPATVQAMVKLHELTGMRSGELLIMRGVDIELQGEGKPWLYRPSKHKTEHHGHQRVVPIGPRAQEVLRPFLNPDVQAFIFSPAQAREERNAAKRAKRKTKVQPSQVNRSKARPKRPLGERYTTASYRRALNYATKMAMKAGDLPAGTMWHPHQLRHNAATRIRRQFGLDAVKATLGHRSIVQSAVYAELDVGLAVDAAFAVG